MLNVAEKLYLVDGMSHIYRAYHAIQGLTNSKGLPTNAVYGFTNMLRKLIQEEEPDYLAVAIDLPTPTVRHEQYKDYKATRRPAPEDLIEQFPYVMQVCEVLRIPVISYERFEADDVIGSLARKAVDCDLEVVIVTIDKDMFQLVNRRVTVLDTRKMVRFDPEKVQEKFGVLPDKVTDVLSLVGDSSDNIPGAPGIGAKGARQLIEEFGSLDALLAARDKVSRKTYRESLQQNEALIQQSRKLVTIYDDLPLELNLEELRQSEPDIEAARTLFGELEFTALLQDFLPSRTEVNVQYKKVEGLEDLRKLGQQLNGVEAAIFLDFPTGEYLEGPLHAISVSSRVGEGWCISGNLLEEVPEEVAALMNKPKKWFTHDLKPIFFFAKRYGWELQGNLLDTMLMAYLLNPNQNDYSLEMLSPEYLRQRFGKGKEGKGQLFESDCIFTLCEQADTILQLSTVLSSQLSKKELESLFNEIEIPLVQVLARMEETGIRLDGGLLETMSDKAEVEIVRLTQAIYEVTGEEFNINSPRQLAHILFEKLNLPVIKKTRKAGHYATGVEVLQELSKTYDVAQLILEYREITKLKNTYLDALPRLVNPSTERIHTSFNQMVAATGRLSSSGPNLQNIPIKSALGREIRRSFVAEDGYKILAADYSQIELRVMAHLSGDTVLTESFSKGEDIHERTAREVFGMSAMMDPQRFRRHAKVINFGIMYGLSAFGLGKSLNIDRKQAQEFIDSYFEKYNGVKAWIEETLSEVYQTGYVKTLFGRIRQIPEIHSKNGTVRNFGERTAINAPIQGTAADLIKKAMVSIDREIIERKLGSKLLLQVHDELVFEVKDSEVEEMLELVREHMEGAAKLAVRLEIDMAVGSSWFDAK